MQARHDEALLGLGRRRLFDDGFHLVQIGAPSNAAAADDAVIRQHGFARRLHRRDGTTLAPRLLDDLLSAAERLTAGVKVVADQVQERLAADEGNAPN